MKKNRVLNAAHILLGFINDGWTVSDTVRAILHHQVQLSSSLFAKRRESESRRTQNRLRQQIKTALESLVAGVNVVLIESTINKHASRPMDLLMWREGEELANRDIPYGFLQPRGVITLAGTKFHIYAAGYPHAGSRQFFYSLLRQIIDDRLIERIKLCRQCKKLFYQKSKKAEFCGDRCRWYFNNHSEDRARHYIKGKWYSDSGSKPKKRGSK
jgi:hypothetical protein